MCIVEQCIDGLGCHQGKMPVVLGRGRLVLPTCKLELAERFVRRHGVFPVTQRLSRNDELGTGAFETECHVDERLDRYTFGRASVAA